MTESKAPITAYDISSYPGKGSQPLPGLDADMTPQAEHTRLERWDNEGNPYLVEYNGSGKLKGKKAIVTGGDSGIGRTVAIFFAREGADVTIVYLPDEEVDWTAHGRQKSSSSLLDARCYSFRWTCARNWQGMKLSRSIAEFQTLDVLVNNASHQVQCPDLADIDMATVEDTFQTNIIQMIGLSKAALPHMKRGSNIINTTSVTAYKGSAAMIDYSSTKGAIASFTRALAQQLLPKGIRVNAVAPGPVYTPLQPASRSPEQMDDWGVGSVPLHGRVGQPAELGESYVYLATSNLSSGTIVHPNSAQYMVP
ncbi:hypothetical protein P7C70_g6532, partial [Phenoliferia sp. Uapishka_3]